MDKFTNTEVLFLGAHPDDIEIGCLGVIHLLSGLGCNLTFCICTSKDERKKEFNKSVNHLRQNGLNIIESYTLDFKDTKLFEQRSELKDELNNLFENKKFDYIFTHSKSDLHQDHRLIAEITLELFRGPNILSYEIPKFDGNPFNPKMFFCFGRAIMQKKVDHLMAHYQSQHNKAWYRPSTFEGTMSLRGVETGKCFAEGFEVIKYIIDEEK
jgi:LmbE family N-acetylglucosaminyl deacetylase|tara:strand:+ start:360 stop:995 length:636 start_codon:yes stop_codon:yes gene_type:complete